MIVLYQISLILFISYILYNTIKFGILQSISEIQNLSGLKKASQWFYGWIISTILPLFIFWLEITDNTPHQPFIFLSCAGLFFVGQTYEFRYHKHVNTIHFISQLICAIMASIWCMIVLECMRYIIPAFFFFLFIIGKKIQGHQRNIITNEIEKTRSSEIFWIELGCFIITYFSIYIFYLSNYL